MRGSEEKHTLSNYLRDSFLFWQLDHQESIQYEYEQSSHLALFQVILSFLRQKKLQGIPNKLEAAMPQFLACFLVGKDRIMTNQSV